MKALGSVAAVLVLTGCISAGSYVWVDQLPEEKREPESYVIKPGDRLNVLVWNQPQLSGPVRVRADGVTTLPLIGDLPVAGLTAPDASEQIKRRLNGLVVEPNVTVTLEESTGAAVSVIGEVRTPGSFPVGPVDTVLHILARAGGLTEFADPKGIFVVRTDNTKRIRFDYDDLVGGRGRGLTFPLRDGDIIVVE